ncbi:hypothetical protein G4L39_00025 [Limisphaera ngatamarikiensis]|uniref:ANTAR domain-containing protein n=1 Tax=Limisphaera ngatamarikiensis TaxID=1324935 RepID=A0A6M1RQT2_9BACT|nr:hypothetical protein [Limisphaera ngatamarikiensis]NGO37794.1 hypothetical protein [Limisphaera ngatamarikiensis]
MTGSDAEAELAAVARLLESLGCPADRSLEMSRHVLRRAEQLARAKGRSREEALAHLLRLFARARSDGSDAGRPGV